MAVKGVAWYKFQLYYRLATVRLKWDILPFPVSPSLCVN